MEIGRHVLRKTSHLLVSTAAKPSHYLILSTLSFITTHPLCQYTLSIKKFLFHKLLCKNNSISLSLNFFHHVKASTEIEGTLFVWVELKCWPSSIACDHSFDSTLNVLIATRVNFFYNLLCSFVRIDLRENCKHIVSRFPFSSCMRTSLIWRFWSLKSSFWRVCITVIPQFCLGHFKTFTNSNLFLLCIIYAT